MAVKATARATFYKREKGNYTFLRYSNDGGNTFTAASQKAIDEAKGSLPLEGRNLLDVGKIARGINVSLLTVTNAATNTFNIVIGTANTIGRIQNVLPFATDTNKWGSRKYVLSGYIKASVSTTVIFDFGDINQNEAAINVTSTSTYFAVTFNSTNFLDSPHYGFIDVNLPTAPTNNISVYFDKLKLEVGSVATAFTETNIVNIENAEKNSLAGRNLLNNTFKYTLENPYIIANATSSPISFYTNMVCRLLLSNVYKLTFKTDGIITSSSMPKEKGVRTFLIARNENGTDNWSLPYYKISDTLGSQYINSGLYTLRFDNMGSTPIKIWDIKLEVGDTATPWTPAPEDCTFGTTEGEYMGTLVWDKPYPSNNPADYTWGKVKGETGKGIASVTEYYQVSSSATTAPTSWLTTPPAVTAANRYLWNYEKITYTDGTSTDTQKRVVGVYGDTGKGISSVTNYYLATTAGSGVTTSTGGWTTSVQAVTAANRYLWNYEVISYTDGTSTTVAPHIIGVWGDTGPQGPKGDQGIQGQTGAAGKDAVTVRLVPDKVVVDTDTGGHVTSAQLTNAVTTVDVKKGAAAYAFTIGTPSASSGIGYTKTTTQVKVASIADDPSTGYAYGSGYIDIPVTVDGVVYKVRLTVETNIHKVVATLKQTTTEITASVTSLTQNVDDYETTTDARLTAAEGNISTNVTEVSGLKTRMTSVEQKADSISMKVSETVLAGNILTGSMFRRESEVTWNNPAYKGVISTAVQLGGVNSVYLESTSTTAIFKGVIWRKIPVTAGKKYSMSFWYKTPDAASNGEMWMEMRGYKADGSATSPSQIVYARITSFVANTWVKSESTFTAPQDLATVDVLIYLVTKGKMYIARPMLIEGSYVGWQRSEQDYDYIGGNLLDETKTLTNRGNIVDRAGVVAANAFGFCSSVHANPTSGYTNILTWRFDYDLNADYTLSFMAKGTGNLDVYLFNDNLDVSLLSEFSGQQRNSTDGNATIVLTPEWKRHTVRWRTKSARTLAWSYLQLRVSSGSDVYIAQPKLEKGCTATEWTDGDGDMVSTKALLATGIDIKNRKVTITSDNVEVQNNLGLKTFDIDENGNIVGYGDATINGRLLATEVLANLVMLNYYGGDTSNKPTLPEGFVYHYQNPSNSSAYVAYYYLPIVSENKVTHKRIICAGDTPYSYQTVHLEANYDGDITARNDNTGTSQIIISSNPNFTFRQSDGKKYLSLSCGIFDLYGMNKDGYTVWYVVDSTPLQYTTDSNGNVTAIVKNSLLTIGS